MKKLEMKELKMVNGGQWGRRGDPGPNDDEWNKIWNLYDEWWYTYPGTPEADQAANNMMDYIHELEKKYGPSEMDWSMYLS